MIISSTPRICERKITNPKPICRHQTIYSLTNDSCIRIAIHQIEASNQQWNYNDTNSKASSIRSIRKRSRKFTSLRHLGSGEGETQAALSGGGAGGVGWVVYTVGIFRVLLFYSVTPLITSSLIFRSSVQHSVITRSKRINDVPSRLKNENE